MVESPLSQHSTDRLIREIIAGRLAATIDDRRNIINRLAEAPFDPSLIAVPPRLRGVTFLHHELRDREPSMLVHLARRVLADRQWSEGTNEFEYLQHLRAAIAAPSSRLAVYHRRGGHIAASLTLTTHCVPMRRRGPESLPWTLVVYSADRGVIVTGYQVSSLETVGLPGDIQWLK